MRLEELKRIIEKLNRDEQYQVGIRSAHLADTNLQCDWHRSSAKVPHHEDIGAWMWSNSYAQSALRQWSAWSCSCSDPQEKALCKSWVQGNVRPRAVMNMVTLKRNVPVPLQVHGLRVTDRTLLCRIRRILQIAAPQLLSQHQGNDLRDSGSSTFLWNIGKLLLQNMAKQPASPPRRQPSSHSPAVTPQISLD